MRKFNRIIVALDNSPFDEKLIRYFDKFCDLVSPQKIHFVYVDKDLELPPGMKLDFTDASGLVKSKDELLTELLEKKVKMGLGNRHGAEVSIDVLEGNALKEILHWVKVKEADLLVMGNKKISEGSGVIAKRIARHTKCDILFVPETSHESIRKILVPVDFSEHSRKAMQGAFDLASELSHTTITAFHTFDVPLTGNPSINMSYERFEEDMSAFKLEALKNYVAGFDLEGVEVDVKARVNELGNPARQIHSFALKNFCDLIVIGAKGRSALERVLLGSVTEKLLSLDKEVPVLLLRE